MSAHHHQASYNGLTWNRFLAVGNTGTEGAGNVDNTYQNSDIRLEWMDPTRLSTEDMRELKQFMEGAEPNEIYEGIRTIHIGGTVLGSSFGDLEDLTQSLHAALSPTRVRLNSSAAIVGTYPDEPSGVLPFDFRLDSVSAATGLPRRFYCRPNVGRPLVFGRRGDGFTRTWQAWLVAYDPRMYGQTLNTQALANINGGTPVGNTIVNAGNEPSYPQIKVVTTGAVGANPTTLTNTTTGQAFAMNLAAFGAAGETFWIMPQRGEIVRSNGDGRYYYRKSGFLDSLYLVAGNNAFTWTPNTGITSVTFYWRDAYA